ncbi:Hint domain-containing protein [Mangrovicoccus sp. HB161399]|uniref:Hint domain-containing protein n=1 Tax=Mangrovicoccus sp. HB161399 TaxID=2720392 RepID=UPI0015575562|nr:Hint domain-containing protein [Mangrovicoccus sp. HB161399]
MSTTFNVIYLGTFSTIDNTEGDQLAENASVLNGTSAGSADQPLWKNIQSFSPGSTGYAGGVSNAYDQSNSPSETFRINGGSDQTFDAVALYNATVYFTDGTSTTTTLVVFQDSTGKTYLAPDTSGGTHADLIASAPIQSVQLTSVSANSANGLTADRLASGFSVPKSVDGTAGSDSMGAGFTDAQGDRIEPNAGAADSISAGAGDDTINSGAGNDTVWAGDGNDVIYASKGNDSLMGEGGNDRFIYAAGDGADTISGGTGTDTLDFSTSTGAVSVLHSGSQAGTFSDGTSTSSFTGIERFALTSYNDTIDAGFSSGSTWIDAGAGNDYIEYGASNSTVYGGDGDDTIDDNNGTRELGNDYLDGGSGNDAIFGDAGADTLLGGTGADSLEGGAGRDILWGGSDRSADTLKGGDDQDTLIISDGFGTSNVQGGEGGTDWDELNFSYATGSVTVTFTGNETGTATNGTDTLSFSQIEAVVLGPAGSKVDASATSGPISITGGSGNDTIYFGSGNATVFGGAGNDVIDDQAGPELAGADSISAGDGNDTVFAGLDSDTISGGTGDDFLDGESGDDLIYGDEGNDWLVGRSGSDTIYGGTGSDLILAGDDNDSLSGGDGSDFLYGEAGNDTIQGDAGADYIRGGTGADLIEGGADADTIYLEDNFGSDTISGGETGTDRDVLDASMMTTGPVTVTFTGDEAGTVSDGTGTASFSQMEAFVLTSGNDSVDGTASTSAMTVDGGAGNDTISGGDGADSISGGDGNDLIFSGRGDDTVSGGAGSDLLITGEGNDSVSGGDGNDTILSEFGDDTIDAGAGDDVIGGSLGRDVITTGTGKDRIIISYNDLQDTITDFDMADDDSDGLSNDQLDVSGLAGGRGPGGAVTVWDVTVTDDGSGNAVLTFPGSESVVLMGVSPASLNTPTALRATGIPCFTPGTMIDTGKGPVPVEQLRPGDRLRTADAGFQPVLWTAQSSLGPTDLAARPEARPVLIRPGGLVPLSRPILVSPQHCMVAEFGGREHFVRARHLTGLPGGMAEAQHGLEPVTYVHVMLPAHHVIFADGARTESLWPGPMAVAMLPAAERAALIRLMPWLAQVLAVSPKLGREIVRHRYGPPARPELPKKVLRRLAREGAQPPNSRGRSASSAKLAAAGRP